MKNRVITICRQFGSGGHEIGKRLAEELEIPFYDKQLVVMAAERTGVIPEKLEEADEKATSPWLYAALDEHGNGLYKGVSANDALFELQSSIIRECAQKSDCVIVGRCADYVLRDEDVELFNIFICAPASVRCARKQALEHWDEGTAMSAMKKADRQRRNYYNYYTGKNWGNPESYDLMLNSSRLGIAGSVQLLAKLLRREKP